MPEVRKLCTITFMDIAGYSAMMQSNEPEAIRIVRLFKEKVTELVPSCQGEIIQFYGDGCLLSFDSSVQAARCTIELQHFFIEEKIPVRAGMHLGEVVFTETNAYGDGVNLASRIESAGIPGSILLSKGVRDQLKNKSDIDLVSLGKISFKNIEEPLEVYAIENEGLSVPTRKSMNKTKITSTSSSSRKWLLSGLLVLLIGAVFFFMPDRERAEANIHTIAVLPFSHESPSEEDAFFTSGMYSDLIVKLATIQDFRIISQSTVAGFSDYTGDMSELGERLNAKYILEGGVRRWEDKVRITTQLVETESNQVIWSHEYNSELVDIFELQSRIATEISTKLEANLSRGERSRIDAAPTTVLAAYDDYLKAIHILDQPRPNYEDIQESISLLNRAVEADKEFGQAWARLIQAYGEQYDQLSRVEGMETERDAAKKNVEFALAMAREVAPDGWEVLQEEAYYEMRVNKDKLLAIELFQKAIERNPSDIFSMYQLAKLYTEFGDTDKSIALLEDAFELTQRNGQISYGLTFAYELTGHYKEMVPVLERMYELYPEQHHYLVEAKYYQFLSDGKLESYREFEQTIQSVEGTNPWDERSIQNKEMVVAMFNDQFKDYHEYWHGKSQAHINGHGNWLCPMVANDHANHLRLLYEHDHQEEADELMEKLQSIVQRPVNLNSVCIFDANVYLPKLQFMAGDSISARKNLEAVVLDVMSNTHFPLGAVERSVLVQAADMIAPDMVYYYYDKAVKNAQSITSFESICADPWTYPNLIRDPQFVKEIREDGRFSEFLIEYGFL